MKERRKDTVFRGETYLEHLADVLRVARPSTPKQIAEIRRAAADFLREADLAAFAPRAEVLADDGEKTEFSADTFAALWKALRAHLLAPEARWLELSIFWPGAPVAAEFRVENDASNLARRSFYDDGQRLLSSSSLPPGAEIPEKEPARLLRWLSDLNARFSEPLPLEFFDSYYSAEELAGRGVRDLETFEAHLRETEGEERWEARLVDTAGKVVWSDISGDEEALREELVKRWNPERGQRWQVSRLARELHPREHPAAMPARYLRADLIRALELIEGQGADSPEARALELGIRIATSLAEIQTIARAPEILKSTRVNRKRPRKGEQKHEAKTEKTKHLRAEILRVLREYEDAGNPLKRPSEILRKLKKCRVSGDRIRHEDDAEASKVSYVKYDLIPALRKEIFEG